MPKLTPRLARYLIVGITVAISYVGIYGFLLSLGRSQPLANGIAFTLAIVLQYAGQTIFTFEKQLADGRQFLRFAVMIAFGYLTSTLITSVFAPTFAIADLLAAGSVAVLLPVQNFALMTLWVYASPAS